MKKNIFIVSVIALVLVLATGIAAAGIADSQKTDDLLLDGGQSGLFSVSSDAESTKVFIKPDKSKVELTYTKTITSNEISQDVYTDSKGDNYVFDKSGRLVSYIMSDDAFNNLFVSNDENTVYISEAVAVKLAVAHAKELFGSAIADFEYVGTRLSSCGNIYYIEHAIKFGENGFVTAATCKSQIGKDGTILTTVMKNYNEALSFDQSLLDGISAGSVRDIIGVQLEETYGDSLDGYSINTVSLDKTNGSYRLKINATAKVQNANGTTKSVNDSYYIELDS